MPIYKLKNKLVLFIHVPKTGGTSVNGYLRLYSRPCLHYAYRIPGIQIPPQHFHGEVLTKIIGEFPIDRKFMFVRNPISRVHSEYRMRMDKLPPSEVVSFDKWWEGCRSELAKCPHYLQNHLRPQHEFLYPEVEIFRFEDGIHSALNKFLISLGLSAPKQKIHARRGRHSEFKALDSTIENVIEFYRKDFEYFDYNHTL